MFLYLELSSTVVNGGTTATVSRKKDNSTSSEKDNDYEPAALETDQEVCFLCI